ncbi:MAG: Serine/threonine-protein kinase PknD [Planctomycetes bacterium]|nr:Serine/threonine-protein kinase PknD [Planctomycetota bacterium]
MTGDEAPAPSRPAEDLSAERLLRGVGTVRHAGADRPVLGKIVLLSRIGQGGAGVVFHGVHLALGTEVALKVLPPDLGAAADGGADTAVQRFLREAQIAARLRSPHLVQVLDVDEDRASGLRSIVMEYVDGASAEDWRRALPDGRADEASALDVVIAATKGLAAAHVAGVVHRDVKPANILIPRAAAGADALDLRSAKLADLGLARTEGGEGGVTTTHVAMGTPGFLAPEQARDAKSARKPADVFSMGATLYALLAGVPPFRGESVTDAILKAIAGEYERIEAVRPDVSPVTAEIVAACLAKLPGERFADGPALLAALEAARAGLTGGPGPASAQSIVRAARERSEQGVHVATPTPSPSPTTSPKPSIGPAGQAPPPARSATPWKWVAALALLAGGSWPFVARAIRGGANGDDPRSGAQAGAAIRGILRNPELWDAAPQEQRIRAARFVAAVVQGFTFDRMEPVSSGGASREVARFTHDATGLPFVLVPGGRFLMGSRLDERDRVGDERPHAVELSRPYLMCVREVDVATWRKVMSPELAGTDANPQRAAWVSWEDARAFAAITGLEIPTEAQWEHACRAGTSTPWWTGEDAASLADAANVADAAASARRNEFRDHGKGMVFEPWDDGAVAIRDVGLGRPNPFGLSDMHGNVAEWVRDFYAPYPEPPAGARGADRILEDPVATDPTGVRIARGGSWADPAARCRSAARHRVSTGSVDDRYGFRPSRTIGLE